MKEQTGRLAYGVDDACDRLSLGRSLFYELVQAGELRTFKVGTRTLIAEAELVSFIDRKIAEAA